MFLLAQDALTSNILKKTQNAIDHAQDEFREVQLDLQKDKEKWNTQVEELKNKNSKQQAKISLQEFNDLKRGPPAKRHLAQK